MLLKDKKKIANPLLFTQSDEKHIKGVGEREEHVAEKNDKDINERGKNTEQNRSK